jgi:EAL domain-containing protein (putative c-di-GMP-specific phosphodiesterase class I)/FixJ family two-component response regulator
MSRSSVEPKSALRLDLSLLSFLVVEDHEFQRNTLVKILERFNARAIHIAADGRSGVEILRRLKPAVDIIVSDLDMPTMDGMEFIRHVGLAWPGTSLIVASALQRDLLSSVEMMARAYGVDFLGTIEKPVTPRKLEELLVLHHRPPRNAAGDRDARRSPIFTADEIAGAIENDEFEPFFQPKVEIATGRIVGAEALARWRHPKQGIVTPYVFVAALEESGRIDMLMRCILRKAAQTSRLLKERGRECNICVNVSTKSLHDVTLADQITEIVKSEGVDPKRIILEITESAATTDVGKSLENLTRLRMKGFGLAIDDYGTGYSSLEQLSRIPFTELKIDQAFVTQADRRESVKVILASNLELARKLKITAVAEGVETRECWDLLVELKCDVAQGYYIAQPMPAAAYLEWVEDWPQMAVR